MEISEKEWNKLTVKLKSDFKKIPDVNAILYLIGIQELGAGIKDFTKEEKQDLLHIATCKILSFTGYYELKHVDEEGWPVWENIKKLPVLSTNEQEGFLKYHILEYFSDIYDI